MRFTQGVALVVATFIGPIVAADASAQVTRIDFQVVESPAFGGESFGDIGQYERLRGVAYGEGKIVVISIFDIGPDGNLGFREQFFYRLGHDVRAVMAQQFERVFVLGRNDGNFRICLKDDVQILHFTVDSHRQRRLGKARADVGGQLRAGHGTVECAFAAVGKSNCNHLNHTFKS